MSEATLAEPSAARSLSVRAALYGRLLRGVIENPRYYWFVTRRRWYSQVEQRLEQGGEPETGTFFPVKLDLRLIYACNLRCKMCGQWGDTGTYFDYSTPKLKRKLELKMIESVVDELRPRGLKYVDMEGGETFLHPQIIDILAMLKSRGLLVKPVTNGTLLKERADDLVKIGVDAIHVSVDGDKDAHNHVRQAEWAYDRTMEGLAAVAEARRRAGRRTPLLAVSFTMTRHNTAESLRRLCDDLNGKGLIDVLAIKASPIWMPQRKGEAYARLVEKHLGATGLTSWQGFVEDYADFEEGAAEVARTVAELKQKSFDFFVSSVPSVPTAELPRFYADYQWTAGRTHCPIPWVEPTIDADGNVYPCNLFPDEAMSMGNVYDRPFLDIWNGERYRAFRKLLVDQGGLLPICNRCCQLTEH